MTATIACGRLDANFIMSRTHSLSDLHGRSDCERTVRPSCLCVFQHHE
jgi:hypothetical protein